MLTRRWLSNHADRVSEPAWRPDLWGWRILFWATHAPLILSSTDLVYRSAVLNGLARGARHLDRSADRAPVGLQRIAAWAGIVAAGLLITGGGVVVGGAGGNLNGKVLDPKSKSAPRASEPNKASKSADIAKALQNRNRNSAASIAQMNRIASNPNPRLMMAAPTMNDGAPVVTDLQGKGIAKLTGHRDWVVTGKREIPVRYAVGEADKLAASNRADGTKNEDYAKDPDKLVAINNGRTAAMIEAYARGTADAYKAAIAKAERVHGIPGKDIKAMKHPALVRIMDAADVDEHIGDESNSTQTLSLSAIEQAQNDAARFDPAGIEYNDDGTPSDASVKGFINAMPESERQSLAPNGRPTKQAIDRMLAATFHAAYGDSELVGLMAQATDPESRNLRAITDRIAPHLRGWLKATDRKSVV